MKRFIKSVVLVTALTLPQIIMPNTELGISEQIVMAESKRQKNMQSVVTTLAEMYPEDTLPTYVLTADLPEYLTAATTGETIKIISISSIMQRIHLMR